MGEDVFSHRGFIFSSLREDTIAGAAELACLSTHLHTGGLPLPEEIYSRNHLSVAAQPGALTRPVDTTAEPGDTIPLIRFSPSDALASWHARQAASRGGVHTLTAAVIDWTYTSPYDGACAHTRARADDDPDADGGMVETDADIPTHLLLRRDPILYYADIPLYSDDLHDRGLSRMSVRMRVMDSCFLVLARMFTRLDGERISMRDVRWYLAFADTAPSMVAPLTSDWGVSAPADAGERGEVGVLWKQITDTEAEWADIVQAMRRRAEAKSEAEAGSANSEAPSPQSYAADPGRVLLPVTPEDFASLGFPSRRRTWTMKL